MDLRTYRASSLQEALQLVRADLGPDASVLHTRDVSSAVLRWLGGSQQIEVTASAQVQVPSRLTATSLSTSVPPAEATDYRAKFRQDLLRSPTTQAAALEELCQGPARAKAASPQELALARLSKEMTCARIPEDFVRRYGERLRRGALSSGSEHEAALREQLRQIIADDLQVQGPLRVLPGRRNLVALVGPTGVGKTTTIAKLAANFRLRQRCSVGLITVDTYRIAAVEQLRTYADIMDLPMEVVSTPREMREAVARLGNLDLVLMDTAGRSPRDDVRIQELRAMLTEAAPDEIHLVLSSTAAVESSLAAMETFGQVGARALMLTKMDEAVSLGSLLPILANRHLPVSYVTHGQNVPDDILPADARRLAAQILACDDSSPWGGSRA